MFVNSLPKEFYYSNGIKAQLYDVVKAEVFDTRTYSMIVKKCIIVNVVLIERMCVKLYEITKSDLKICYFNYDPSQTYLVSNPNKIELEDRIPCAIRSWEHYITWYRFKDELKRSPKYKNLTFVRLPYENHNLLDQYREENMLMFNHPNRILKKLDLVLDLQTNNLCIVIGGKCDEGMQKMWIYPLPLSCSKLHLANFCIDCGQCESCFKGKYCGRNPGKNYSMIVDISRLLFLKSPDCPRPIGKYVDFIIKSVEHLLTSKYVPKTLDNLLISPKLNLPETWECSLAKYRTFGQTPYVYSKSMITEAGKYGYSRIGLIISKTLETVHLCKNLVDKNESRKVSDPFSLPDLFWAFGN